MNLSQNDQWFDDMVLELRLRDVRGDAIGDAVAAARSHCAESGETPAGAFGDPRDYARSLEFADRDLVNSSIREWARVFAPVVVGIAGFSLVTGTVTVVLKGAPADVSWGALASAALLVLFAAFLARHLRLILDRPVAGMLLVGGAFAVMVVLPILWSTPAFVIPTLIAAAVGVVLLGASVVLGRWAKGVADPVVDPLTHQDRYASSPRAWTRLFTGEWVFVTWTVLVSLLLWGLATVV